MKKIKILYLYTELGPYNTPVFQELVKKNNCEIDVIHWKNLLSPYKPKSMEGVNLIKREGLKRTDIENIITKSNPEIIVVSGWVDRDYLGALRNYSGKAKVVINIDDQWRGSIRQIIGSVYYRLFLKNIFDVAWVAGVQQYFYARMFGFKDKNIIYDLLSADIKVFHSSKNESEKNFLYVGRFVDIKGINLLSEAYDIYRTKHSGKYGLICVGNGEFNYPESPKFKVHGYTNQDNLLLIANECEVLILPSIKDQWGLVVHEFSLLGMPLLLSEGVGAKNHFLINNFNGYLFKLNSSADLAKKMKKYELLTQYEKEKMSENSRNISKRITPETAAANLLSILE